MLYGVLYFLFMAVCVEAITELVVKSKIFFPIRKLFENRKNIVLRGVNELITCGHCTSVWVSALVCTVAFFMLPEFFFGRQKVVIMIFAIIVVHRVSNYLHFFVDRLDKFYDKKE